MKNNFFESTVLRQKYKQSREHIMLLFMLLYMYLELFLQKLQVLRDLLIFGKFYSSGKFLRYRGDRGGISWNLSSLTSTVTFLILIGYEALSLTVAMVIVSEWQIVSDDKFHEIPPWSIVVTIFTF